MSAHKTILSAVLLLVLAACASAESTRHDLASENVDLSDSTYGAHR